MITMKIFDMDGPFQKYGTMVFDLFLLNLLWFLCVIFTLGIGTGAATTALFYVVDKSIIREKGYVLSNYFKSFKSNFLRATLTWVLLAIAFAIIIVNLFFVNLKALPFAMVIQVVNYGAFIQLVFISIYIFQLIARVEIKTTKDYFLTAFKLANRHVLSSFICVIILVTTAILIYMFPIYFILAPGITAVLLSKIVIGRVLKKYFEEGAFDN